jgi:hypothetical protein
MRCWVKTQEAIDGSMLSLNPVAGCDYAWSTGPLIVSKPCSIGSATAHIKLISEGEESRGLKGSRRCDCVCLCVHDNDIVDN